MPAPCDRHLGASTRCAAGKPEHPRAVLATTILASSLAFIDGSVLNVALPAIERSFEAGSAQTPWVINAFLLPLSALLLVGGAAGDVFGRRRLLLAGIALFTLASMLCAAAPSFELFIAGRVLQGVGAAMLMPNSLAILSDTFSGEDRGKAVGTWAAAGAVSGATAPLLGGWIVGSIGWPAIFLLNVPIAVAAIWLSWRFVPESADRDRAFPDWIGALLATLGLGGLTWALTTWSATGRLGPAGAALLAAGTLFCLFFLFVQRKRGDEAMVPLDLFGSRPFVGLNLLTFLLYGALGGLMVILPYTLIEALEYPAVTAGAALLPLPILIALGSPLAGRMAARIGPRWPLTIGPMIVAAGFLLMLRIGDGASYWTNVLPAIFAVSAGMAMAVAPLTTAILGSVDPGHTGTASGLNSAVARSGGLIATALLGAVLSKRAEALVDGFHVAAMLGAALAIASALTAFAFLDVVTGRQGARAMRAKLPFHIADDGL